METVNLEKKVQINLKSYKVPNTDATPSECLQLLESAHIEELIQINKDYDLAIAIIEELKKKIQRMEMQNEYLKNENNQYREKLSRITDTQWGQAALFVYRKLRSVKAKLNGK